MTTWTSCKLSKAELCILSVGKCGGWCSVAAVDAGECGELLHITDSLSECWFLVDTESQKSLVHPVGPDLSKQGSGIGSIEVLFRSRSQPRLKQQQSIQPTIISEHSVQYCLKQPVEMFPQPVSLNSRAVHLQSQGTCHLQLGSRHKLKTSV